MVMTRPSPGFLMAAAPDQAMWAPTPTPPPPKKKKEEK